MERDDVAMCVGELAYFCEWVTKRDGDEVISTIRILDDSDGPAASNTLVGQLAGALIVGRPITDKSYVNRDIALGNISEVEEYYDGRFVPSPDFAEELEGVREP